MSEKKEPHKQMTDKNNGLSSTQEVLYADDYKKADKVAKSTENRKKNDSTTSFRPIFCWFLKLFVVSFLDFPGNNCKKRGNNGLANRNLLTRFLSQPYFFITYTSPNTSSISKVPDSNCSFMKTSTSSRKIPYSSSISLENNTDSSLSNCASGGIASA